MVCNHYIYRNPNTGDFYVAKSGTDFFLYSDCGTAECPLCDGTCTLEETTCKCYDLLTQSNIELVGSAPGTPPQSGYYLPRYATVTIGGSDAVAPLLVEWELWTPSGVCDPEPDPFGDPGTVNFHPLSTGLEVGCAGGGSFSTGGQLEIEWNGAGWDIDWRYNINNCGGVFGGCDGGQIGLNIPLQVRYRRAYGDYVTKESQSWIQSENCDFGSGGYNNDVTLSINFHPTCRPPETSTYCNCIDGSYNIIDISELDTYSAPVEEGSTCCGKPIDIDSSCGNVGAMTSWVLYYAPVANTIPIISGVAYDTINITDGTGIEVIKLRTFSTQSQARNWVCNYLKFATVGAGWPGNTNDLEYDWPYNDLYFNACEPGTEGAINLVPC